MQANMLLRISQYGDPVLRIKCAPVSQFDNALKDLADNMLETMYAAEGIGLAAPQVSESIQLVVIDFPPPEEDEESPDIDAPITVNGQEMRVGDILPLCFVNPNLEPYGKMVAYHEGCLSVYKIKSDVRRPERLRGNITLLDGSVMEIDCGGLFARCLQHECDHLNGIVFTDRVSSAQKITLKNKLKRLAQDC